MAINDLIAPRLYALFAARARDELEQVPDELGAAFSQVVHGVDDKKRLPVTTVQIQELQRLISAFGYNILHFENAREMYWEYVQCINKGWLKAYMPRDLSLQFAFLDHDNWNVQKARVEHVMQEIGGEYLPDLTNWPPCIGQLEKDGVYLDVNGERALYEDLEYVHVEAEDPAAPEQEEGPPQVFRTPSGDWEQVN